MANEVLTTSATYGRTVRQRIIDALKIKLAAMQDDEQPVWKRIEQGDIESVGNEALPAVALDVGTEEKISVYGGCQNFQLPVFYHFRFRGQLGLDELDKFHYYLGLLQMAVLADHTLGGLTFNVEEIDNAHTIIGIKDVYPGGTLHTRIDYRTRVHDPYKLMSEN